MPPKRKGKTAAAACKAKKAKTEEDGLKDKIDGLKAEVGKKKAGKKSYKVDAECTLSGSVV